MTGNTFSTNICGGVKGRSNYIQTGKVVFLNNAGAERGRGRDLI